MTLLNFASDSRASVKEGDRRDFHAREASGDIVGELGIVARGSIIGPPVS